MERQITSFKQNQMITEDVALGRGCIKECLNERKKWLGKPSKVLMVRMAERHKDLISPILPIHRLK